MLLVWFTIFLCSAYAAQNENNDASPDILGGFAANIEQFPFQVSLREKKHFCGGSIISDQWVLTSAACLYGRKPSNVKVLMGTNNIKKGGKTYKTSKFVIHEAFQPSTQVNDIALILVKERIKFSNKILPATLAAYGAQTPVWLTLSGWGYTKNTSSKFSDILQQVNVYSVDAYQCSGMLPGFPINTGNLCTTAQIGQGGCTGDVGGPLTDNSPVVFGIYSYGISCGAGKPDVYTSVPYYREWIRFTSGV